MYVAAYPFLRTASGLCDEADRMQPSAVNVCRRWKEGFTGTGRTCWQRTYQKWTSVLPHIFKEKADQFVTSGQHDAPSPYPTVQLVDTDWKTAFPRKVPVTLDSVDLCRGHFSLLCLLCFQLGSPTLHDEYADLSPTF
ncbi:hypothetical protein KUCAC02_020437 [Chaenocephalus aceratus]|nr:hypothetical protein KUCAC02_020437 [Chaenocephalus aceratus]